MTRTRNASVAFILVTLFLDTLGIGVIIPVLPKLVQDLAGGDVASGSRYYGVFVAVYAAMQFVFAPILGGLSDRFGRRTVLLASLCGAAFDYLLLALAPSLAWLFVGRVIAGITGASFSAATAYIADITPPAKRAASFGLVGAAFGVGFIVGPALGGFVGGVHLRAPFYLAAGLNLLNFLYGLFVLPESLDRKDRRAFTFRRANPLSSLVNLGRHRIVIGLTGTLVCAYLSQAILHSCWALHTQTRFHWSPADIGGSLAVVGVMAALVQGGLVRVVMPKLGERRALLLGFMMSGLGFAAFGLATSGWMMYAILVPFALGGIAGPAIQALISGEVGPSEQGELQGSLASLMSVTAIVGPLVGTSLIARFGPEDAVPRIPGAAFFAAALLNLCGLLLAMRLFARLPPAAARAKAASADPAAAPDPPAAPAPEM